jgi:hypothetical protein
MRLRRCRSCKEFTTDFYPSALKPSYGHPHGRRICTKCHSERYQATRRLKPFICYVCYRSFTRENNKGYSYPWGLCSTQCREPWRAYQQQKNAAKKRKIAWEITFEKWWNLWRPHWNARGRCEGQLVMARFGDKGAYASNNVEIITCQKNSSLIRREYKPRSAEQRARMSATTKEYLARNRPNRCKFTDAQVREIRNSTESRMTLAAHYGVAHSAIYKIKSKQTYANVK